MGTLDNFEWYEYIGNKPTAWEGHLLWAYSEIPKINPKTIVELGVHWGHSLFMMAESCQDHGIGTTLYGIDHWQGDVHAGKFTDEVYETSKECSKLYPNVKLIKKTFSEAEEDWDGEIDLLHIDGRHLYEDIKEDFENWVPYVKNGGWVWLHDTQVQERNFGIHKYFKELKKNHPKWEFSERVESKGLGKIRIHR
jgi:cephalosporin hydroxylase